MKVQPLVWTVAGIAALLIAFLIGRHLQGPTPIARNADRLVTISVSPTSPTDCEVDYPVASLKQNVNKIAWVSNDKEYWVSFLPLGENPPGYTPESPLVSQANIVVVPPLSNSPPDKFDVKYDQNHVGINCPGCPDYYMYAIYDHDPATNPNNPCKKASIEHDTGVIVKR